MRELWTPLREHGGVHVPEGSDELADETWPHRAGIGWTSVFDGPLPQLVWPADRSWVVATEIDWVIKHRLLDAYATRDGQERMAKELVVNRLTVLDWAADREAPAAATRSTSARARSGSHTSSASPWMTRSRTSGLRR